MSAPIDPHAFEKCLSQLLSRLAPEATLHGAVSTSTGFVAGTRIATPMGYVAVERLAVGDPVLTSYGRVACIDAVGVSLVTVTPETALVRIETGTLANISPLRLAQGHRISLSNWNGENLRGSDAVLTNALSLVNGQNVTLEVPTEPVEFVQLMFERPNIVLAENVPCETLCIGEDRIAQRDAA